MVKAVFGLIFALLVTFSASAATPGPKQPDWKDLPAEHQKLLGPLAERWDGFNNPRKKMWLDIAAKYPTLPEAEQAKVQRRLQRWVKLTQDERRTVRDNYKTLQKLPPDKKQVLRQEWDAYNKLPDDQKQKLQDSAKASKNPPKSNVLAAPPSGQ